MATENLIIRVSETGARVVSRNINDIGKKSSGAAKAVKLLGTALVGAVTGLTLRNLVRYGDQFTQIQNRLRLVTDSTEQLNAVQSELLALSNRTRSSFENNAEIYNRLALSTKELGLTQREVLELTEGLNQAVQISGATTQEASAGLIQLSQGLASGALRGDELRSVLEQLPAVADVIAKELGVTRGELRELGSEGKITADIVTRAFANARDELGTRFGSVVPTVGQALVVLGNQAVDLFGKLDQGLGITEGLSDIILTLAGSADDLGDVFRDAGLAVREFVTVASVSLFNFFDTIGPRWERFKATVVGTIATLLGDDAVVEATIADALRAEATIKEIQGRLQRDLDIIQEDFRERRAAFAEDASTLDDPRSGGGGARAAALDEVNTATQKLVASQEELLQSLLLEERAMNEALQTGGDFSLILARMQTDAIAAQTGMEGLAFDINETRGELASLRQEQERGEFLQTLQQENEALVTATKTGRDVNDVLAEMAIRRQFINDQEGLERALDLTVANERLREGLDQSESALNDFLTRSRENAQDILGDALSKAFTGGLEELPERFANMLLQLSSQWFASEIFRQLSQIGQGGSGSGGGGSQVLQAIGSYFAGSFANGGQFTVGGSGGTDSQLVSMAVTPRERVTIETPQQQQQAAPQVNVAAPPAQVIVVDSEEKAVAAIQSSRGSEAVLNVIRDNPEAVRGMIGG